MSREDLEQGSSRPDVALADRDAPGLHDLAATLHNTTIHVVNLRDRAQVAALIPTVLEEHKRIDVVIANAGWTTHGRFEKLSLDEIDGVLEIDLRSVLHLVHHALPHLRSGGHILLTVSMAAKHGLVGFGDALRCGSSPPTASG